MNARCALAALPLLLAACGPGGGLGTDSGNAFTAQLSVGSEGLLAAGARDVASVTGAWGALHELEFKPCDGQSDVEVDYEGEHLVDLLGGETLGEVELDFDVVCELEFELEIGEEGEAHPVDGFTLRLDGVTSAGADFSIRSVAEWKFEVEEELPLQDALNRLTLLFDLDQWLEGLDPDLGTPTGDLIVVDSTTNPDLLDVFEDNVGQSARLDTD